MHRINNKILLKWILLKLNKHKKNSTETEINSDVQYEDCDCYFNKDTLETENIEVVLEIMQLYDGSLNKYLDNLNLSNI